MKKLLISGAAIAVALAVAPKFVGQSYQDEYHNILDKLANNPEITVSKRHIETSWFSGNASTTFSFDTMGGTDEVVSITVNESLNFGPLIFSEKGFNLGAVHSVADVDFSTGIFDEETIKEINDKLDIVSLFSFAGDYVTDINVEAFDFEDEHEKVAIGALNSQFSLLDSSKLVGSLNWDGMKVTSPEANIVVDKLAMTFDQYTVNGDIYDTAALMAGDAKISFEGFSFFDPTSNATVAAKNAVIDTGTNIKDKMMDVTATYAVAELITPAGNYNKANLAVTLTNLDMDILQQISEQMANLPAPDSPEYMQSLEQVAPTALKLLDHNPEIKVTDLSVETPQGKVISDATVTLNKDLVNIQNPATLFMAAKAVANGKVPEALLANFGMQQMVDAFVQQGLLTREQTDISVKATFENGQLLLNGKPLQM